MRVLVVSTHNLKGGLAALARIRMLAGALADHLGPERVHWLNIMQVSPSDWRGAGERARSLPELPFGVTMLRQLEIPGISLITRRLTPLALLAWVRMRYGSLDDLLLWAEMTVSARPVLLLQRVFDVPLVVDVHGTIDEVIQFDKPSTRSAFRYARFVFHEAQALFAATGMVAVSERMLSVYRRRYGHLPSHTAVVPCVQEPPFRSWDRVRRDELRRRFGLEGRFVFVYAGGTHPWQCTGEMLDLFARCARAPQLARLRPLLLMLTWDRDAKVAEQAAAAGVGESDVIIRSVPQAEVSEYLLASDVGLLLRRDLTTNLVSSPTKAAEYLQAGIPLICTPHIGDVSNIVRESDVGYLVDLDASGDVSSLAEWIVSVDTARETMARHCMAVGEECFGPAFLVRVGELVDRIGRQ